MIVAVFALAAAFTLPANATAIDGDTIKTWDDQPNIRLAVIDAPELPGHCRAGRVCVSGDPWRAKRQLQTLINNGHWRCTTLRIEYYGRRLAKCKDGKEDMGVLMLVSGTVGLYHYTPRKGY